MAAFVRVNSKTVINLDHAQEIYFYPTMDEATSATIYYALPPDEDGNAQIVKLVEPAEAFELARAVQRLLHNRDYGRFGS